MYERSLNLPCVRLGFIIIDLLAFPQCIFSHRCLTLLSLSARLSSLTVMLSAPQSVAFLPGLLVYFFSITLVHDLWMHTVVIYDGSGPFQLRCYTSSHWKWIITHTHTYTHVHSRTERKDVCQFMPHLHCHIHSLCTVLLSHHVTFIIPSCFPSCIHTFLLRPICPSLPWHTSFTLPLPTSIFLPPPSLRY